MVGVEVGGIMGLVGVVQYRPDCHAMGVVRVVSKGAGQQRKLGVVGLKA